jgi:putative transposase
MNHHFVWSPRYRRGLLVGQIAARLKALIAEKADELGYRVLQLEVMPDHVHLFASGSPTMSANRIVGAIKGYSSRVLRREFPVLLKMPTLWTRSYFVSTAGDVSAKVIEQYIRSQRGTRP